MKLCIGTAQFGMDYGIHGQKKPTMEESVTILDYALHSGVSAIDTAAAYGNAQEVVGEFIRRHTVKRDDFFLSTKCLPNILDDVPESKFYSVIRSDIENSLKKLNTDHVDSYMLHSARYIFRDDILDALYRIKEDGLAIKVGVSVYEPEEALKGLNDAKVEFMQFPYSIFDQRMKQKGIFDDPDKDTIIHTRSAFIQGLITMNSGEVPDFLRKARPIVDEVDRFCLEHDISRISLALQYIKQTERISRIVIGVDNIDQLKEDIYSFNTPIDIDLLKEAEDMFSGLETDIVMPSLWKKDV